MLVNPFTRLGKGAGMRTQRAEEALRVRGGEQSRDHPPMQKGFSRPPDRDHVRLISLFEAVGVTMQTHRARPPTFSKAVTQCMDHSFARIPKFSLWQPNLRSNRHSASARLRRLCRRKNRTK
jgi:hypothetical protein